MPKHRRFQNRPAGTRKADPESNPRRGNLAESSVHNELKRKKENVHSNAGVCACRTRFGLPCRDCVLFNDGKCKEYLRRKEEKENDK